MRLAKVVVKGYIDGDLLDTEGLRCISFYRHGKQCMLYGLKELWLEIQDECKKGYR